MNNREMLTEIDGAMLAEAFPSKHHFKAALAGEATSRLLREKQWTERFAVIVEGERVFIPQRLHFASDGLSLPQSDDVWRFARALQTRSNDGFQRQRAARDLLMDLQPWSAAFIVALIGEYIVQILDDIAAALTQKNVRVLGTFIAQNQAYWETTKRRVTSYWNVYYRSELANGSRPEWALNFRPFFQRDEYVGFRVIEQIEGALSGENSGK